MTSRRQRYYQIKPGRKHVKTAIVRLVMLTLGHAFQTAYRIDPEVKKEVDSWPPTFHVVLEVEPDGPRMTLIKRNGALQYLGEKELYNADVVIVMKSIEFMFRMTMGMMSMPRIVAENRQYMKGDLVLAGSIIRCMNRVQTMMIPVVTGLYIKKVPPLSLRMIKNRIIFWTCGVWGLVK
ncbi:MAG: hypothetical protein B5M56_06045 [Desulfococcus sp. 4484_241]|nr:MAG: hypothetical protein B5M56_06045 [Desulfococcus sp. 4484_241]